jgi:hypothetical protein
MLPNSFLNKNTNCHKNFGRKEKWLKDKEVKQRDIGRSLAQ